MPPTEPTPDLMARLRESLEQALAIPGGREPTAAHPDCRCHQRKPPKPAYQLNESARYVRELAVWKAEHGSPREDVYRRCDCPVHAGTARVS